MLNNLVLIGRIVEKPKVETTPTGKKVAEITLAVTRSFKNSQGMFETDFIKCRLWEGIAQSTADYCDKGSLIAIKGRLQVRSHANTSNKNVSTIEVIAERVTFLNNTKS